MLPVVLGFLEPVGTELLIGGDVIHALVIRKHRDHLVVDLTAVIEFHDADDAGLHQGAGHQRFGHAHDLDVEGIAVLVPGAGDAAVGEGIGEGGVADPIELEVAGFGDQLVLVDRVGVELHDGVEPQLGLIGEGRQHVKQVQHRAAGSVVDVRHGRALRGGILRTPPSTVPWRGPKREAPCGAQASESNRFTFSSR